MFYCSKLDYVREPYGDIISTNRHLCSEDFVLKISKLVRYIYDERKSVQRINLTESLLTTLLIFMKLETLIPIK